MMKKRNKFTNRWRKFLVIGLAVLIAGSSSLQSAVALEEGFANRDKKVKNEKQENIQKYIPGQVIVKLKEGISSDYEFLRAHRLKSAEKVLKENKSGKNVKAEQAMKKHGLDRIYLAEFSLKEDLTKVLERLNRDSRVEYAEPNYEITIDAIPNDLYFPELWGLNNTGQAGGVFDADIDAVDAWDTQTGSHDVVIAVIDTGVDYNHPDLALNIWTNEAELNGIPNSDDDGNGYVDDIYGYDFANYDGNPMDDHGHGTHCAGTIGAVGNNGIGVAGVNWNVSIMPVKFLSASGSGSTDGAIASVNYATLMGVDVMSNSWGGGPYSEALEDAISAANDAGILFVAAAGNSNSNNDIYPHYPSSYNVPNVVSVAATDRNDNRASFSCYGAESVDLGAPGVDIYSTVPTGLCELCDPSGYKYLSGTSMATPHVAGAAGLLKAEYPLLTSDGIKGRLFGGVDLISSMDGITVTGGRLNVLNSLEDDIIPPASVSTLAVSGATYNSVSLTWIAVGDDDYTGTASSYDVRYSIHPIVFETDWNNATQAQGEPLPQAYESVENFTVKNLGFDTTYHFALKVIDNVGNYSEISNDVPGTTETVTIVFSDDMENGTGEWTHGGVYDNWELGLPISGPGFSSSGLSAWATDLDGNYGEDNLNIWLASPSINLNGIESTQLVFQHYYYTESYWDGGIVEISTDGGASWTQIMPEGGYPEDALSSGNPLGSVPAYSGYSGAGWHPAVFDISSYDGYSNINIRFRFGTDYSINYYPGWYIDDVMIFGQGGGENIPPTANAGENQIVSDADGDNMENITLDGSGSRDLDGNIVSYEWFEDFDSVTDPSFIGSGEFLDYDFSIGEHWVTLVVEDNEGAIATDKILISVTPNKPPVADAGEDVTVYDSDGIDGEDVMLYGSESYDPDGYELTYRWEEGGAFLSSDSCFLHNYSIGTHTITLTVTDIGGAIVTDDVIVTVIVNDLPIADAGLDQTVNDMDGNDWEAVLLDGSGSNDPDGTIVSYQWFEGMGASPICSSVLPKCEYPFSIGTHIITLIVTDDDGATADDDVVIFVNQPPIADAGEYQPVNDADGNQTEAVILNGSGSIDPEGGILTYEWKEGDIPLDSSVSFSYDFPIGPHTITLTVMDDNGAIATDSVSIIVNPNQSPTANITIDQIVGETVDFNGLDSTDPDGDIFSYEWDFGDGTTGSGPSITHVYSSYGDHTVTLTVMDNGGAIATDTVIVMVEKIIIESAVYDHKKDTLTIKATSSAGSDVVLTASSSSNFENVVMRYDSRNNIFKVTIRKITLESGSGFVTSSLGGLAEFSWQK